jgi:hypothetical protein
LLHELTLNSYLIANNDILTPDEIEKHFIRATLQDKRIIDAGQRPIGLRQLANLVFAQRVAQIMRKKLTDFLATLLLILPLRRQAVPTDVAD